MDKVETYEDAGGGWRWRKRAPNGRIVSVSGESFYGEQEAERAADRERRSIKTPRVGLLRRSVQ